MAPQLSDGAQRGYRAGLAAMVRLNKKTVLRLAEKSPLFSISYAGSDERLIQNFEVEAFTVAGVLQYEAEERLKAMAKSIIDGTHPVLQKNPEQDVKALWRDEAYNILADYIDVPDMPPPGQLQTNLRTATNSAYQAAQWQRLQGVKDIYPAYRYKTRNDDRVRDEHALLHDIVARASDPIWQTIWPPNGWNCRCYIEPLSEEELATIAPEMVVNLTDTERRESLVKSAKIDPDFMRNSGKSESIWGKWLKTKLEGKVYREITERMKIVVKQMPKPEEVIIQLERNASPFRSLEYSPANVESEFPEYKVVTPLGEFSFSKKFWTKLEGERRELFGLVKPTMMKPDYIMVDAEYGTLFLKGYKKGESHLYIGVIGSESGHIISFHRKRNLEDKIKNGKLLIYQAEGVLSHSSRGAGSPDSFVELPSVSGRFTDNIADYDGKVNEIWGEFIKPGKTVIRRIRYRVEGFDVIEGEAKEWQFSCPYEEIDDYRRGVLLT